MTEPNIEIVMTRESYECLEPLIPAQVLEEMPAPLFLRPSGTTPHQVVLSCNLKTAETLLQLARPTCGPAADRIQIAVAEYQRAGSA